MKCVNLILLPLLLTGCSILKASPAPSSGFLPDDKKLSEMRHRAPFNGSYVPDRQRLEALKARYRTIVIPPIDTEPLHAQLKSEGSSVMEREDRVSDAQELGRYFTMRMTMEFEERGFRVATEAQPGAFIWEVAIVELEPTAPAVNAAATAAGFFVPGAGIVRRFATGSIAIEGIVRNSGTGDVLVEFKDREADKESLFTLRDFRQYSHSRAAIDDWAEQFAILASTSESVLVPDSLPVTLNPL